MILENNSFGSMIVVIQQLGIRLNISS